MKNLFYYLSIIFIGILLPFIVVIVCKKLNYENELIVPIISSVTTIVTIVLKSIIDLKNKKNNNGQSPMNTSTKIFGKNNNVISGNYRNED